MNTTQGLMTGAVAATAMTIAVYEGRVDILSGDEVTTLTAGERARVASTGAVSRAETPGVAAANVARALERVDGPSVGAARRAWTRVPGSVLAADEVSPEAVKALRSKNARLERQIKSLTAEVVELRAQDSRDSTFDPDPVALQRMARECELAWDMPSVNVGRPPKMSERQIRRAEISEAEAEVVNRVFAEFNDTIVEQTRALYIEVTGDDQVSSQSVQSMFAEINDKVGEREKQFVFQRLSAERAGLAPPPADLSQLSPFERMYRLYTTVGAEVEAAIASELGAETAHRIRAASNGFGTQSRSSYGCPR